MTFNEKVIALHEYIVGNVSTTRMAEYLAANYGINIESSEFNAVLPEYGINYNDRGTGKQGFGKGQHLGAYKNGFRAEDGQVYEVSPEIIRDYMTQYKSTNINIDDYLDSLFNRRSAPPAPAPSPAPNNYSYGNTSGGNSGSSAGRVSRPSPSSNLFLSPRRFCSWFWWEM